MRHSKLLLAFALITTTAFADTFNTNPLIERGIDPHILNLSVTPFKQKLAYSAEAVYTIKTNGEEKKHTMNLVFDPYKSYGIDIRMQVPLNELHNYDESEMVNDLDQLMGLQSYLQAERLYDQSSVRFEGHNGEMDVVSFNFNDDAIPREIKQFKDFEGKVFIANDELRMIEVTNHKPYRDDGIDVKHFKKRLYFSRVKGHSGYLLEKTIIELDGTKDEKPYALKATTHIISYWNKKEEPIYLENSEDGSRRAFKEGEYKTFSVNLDRTLPLLGQQARREGYDLPKAYGISLITMMQSTRFYMTSFEVDGKDLSKYFDKSSKYENSTMVSMVQFDTWILPFLNVGVMVGGTDSSTTVTLDTTNRCLGGVEAPDGSCILADVGGKSITLDPFRTNSVLYGFGTTLAGGVGDFFGTINLQYMTSYTKAAEVKTEIIVITPMFGYYFKDYGVRVMGGGMYEDLKESLDFDLTGGDIPLKGTIGLGAEKWAGTLGVNYDFTRHWTSNLIMAYGVDFQNLNFVVGYRW